MARLAPAYGPRGKLRRLAGSLIDLSVEQPFGLYMARYEDPLSALALQVEQEVFEETFGDSPELLAAEYGAYQRSSIFFVVVDHEHGLPVGMTRIILPSPAGLKTAIDLEPGWGKNYEAACEATGIPCVPEATWDVATLAVSPPYRGTAAVGLVSASLYQALSMMAMRCGGDWYLAILHASVLRMLQWRLQSPFGHFTGVEAKAYLGSGKSLPVWGNLREWHARLAAKDPAGHALMCEGRGLESEVRPPDWDELATTISDLLVAQREALPTSA